MNKIISLILILVSQTVSASMSKSCYNLKDFNKNNQYGFKDASSICEFYFSENKQRLCFFTSDKGNYTHTFEVPCNQFTKLNELADKINLKTLIKKLNKFSFTIIRYFINFLALRRRLKEYLCCLKNKLIECSYVKI